MLKMIPILARSLSLTVLTFSFLHQISSNKALIHLVIGVQRIDVIWIWRIGERTGKWLCRKHGAHVVEVGVWDYALISELFGHVATDCGTYLELVVGVEAAKVLQIGGDGFTNHYWLTEINSLEAV